MNVSRKLFSSVLIVMVLMMLFGAAASPVSAEGDPGAIVIRQKGTTTFGRSFTWSIDKTGPSAPLLLSVGQTATVNYSVVVNAVAVEGGWKASGEIAISNLTGTPAVINSITAVMSDYGTVPLTCYYSAQDHTVLSFPYEISAYWTYLCNYDVTLTSGAARTNTVTVVMADGSPVAGATDTADVTFGSPASDVDDCITVNDDKYGNLGTICASEAPKTFNYSMVVGPYNTCGSYEVLNTASFVTNDTGTRGSDGHTVNINVPCAGGCTLTPGYWKTHSIFGPAPYDANWANLGENTPFFLSTQTYYQVLWTTPSGGNAYYILAHAYIAAKLNVLDGASGVPTAAMTYAENFFNQYTPTSTLLKAVRNEAILQAGILDAYNNGLTGPGHCTE